MIGLFNGNIPASLSIIESAEALWVEVRELWLRGSIRDAIILLEQRISETPVSSAPVIERAVAVYLLADAYCRVHRYEDAIKFLEREDTSRFNLDAKFLVLTTLAHAFFAQKDSKRGGHTLLDAYSELKDHSFPSPVRWDNLVVALAGFRFNEGCIEEARTLYAQVVENSSSARPVDVVTALFGLIACERKQSGISSTFIGEWYEQLLDAPDFSPFRLDLLLSRGLYRFVLGRYEEAVSDFTCVVESAEVESGGQSFAFQHYFAHRHRAEAYFAMGSNELSAIDNVIADKLAFEIKHYIDMTEGS